MSEAVDSDPVPKARRPALARRLFFGPLRLFVSIVAAQSFVGAVLLLGYLYRRMQNHAIAVWTEAKFVSPRWLFSEEPSAPLVRRYTGALWQHLRTGISGAFATGVMMLPSGALMAVSWYAGWNNSFNKGYEFAAIGPLLGLVGIVLGMLALGYLPYAQARHALTGDWRMFFRWRQNLQLIGTRPFANLVLPVFFAGTALTVAGARGLLTFAPQMPAFAGLEADPGGFMGSWFFWWGVPFVVLLFISKRLASRLYATAVMKALTSGDIAHGELHDAERYYIRGSLGTSTITRRRGIALLLLRAFWHFPLWFPVFGMLYVQQFVNNVGAWGWVNHPALWLPVLAYSP